MSSASIHAFHAVLTASQTCLLPRVQGNTTAVTERTQEELDAFRKTQQIATQGMVIDTFMEALDETALHLRDQRGQGSGLIARWT